MHFHKALHRQPLEQAWQARSAVIAARESRDGGDAEVAAARHSAALLFVGALSQSVAPTAAQTGETNRLAVVAMNHVLKLGRRNGRGGEAHKPSSWSERFHKALHR